MSYSYPHRLLLRGALVFLLVAASSIPTNKTRRIELKHLERYSSEALALSPEWPYSDMRLAAVSRRRFLHNLIALVMAVRFSTAQSGNPDLDPKKLLDRVLDRIGGSQALRLRYPEFDQAVLQLVPPDDQALRTLAKAFILYLMVKNDGTYGLRISKEAHEIEDYFWDKVLNTAGGTFRLSFRMALASSRKNLEREVYRAISRDLADAKSLGHHLLVVRHAQNADTPVEISRVTTDVMMSTFLRYFGLTGTALDETRKDWTVDDEFLTTDLGPLQQVVKLTGVAPFRLSFSDLAGFCVSAIQPAHLADIKANHLDKVELSAHLPKSKGSSVIGSIINELGAQRFINSLHDLRTFTGLGPVLAPYWLRAEDEERIVTEIQSKPSPGHANLAPPRLFGLAQAA